MTKLRYARSCVCIPENSGWQGQVQCRASCGRCDIWNAWLFDGRLTPFRRQTRDCSTWNLELRTWMRTCKILFSAHLSLQINTKIMPILPGLARIRIPAPGLYCLLLLTTHYEAVLGCLSTWIWGVLMSREETHVRCVLSCCACVWRIEVARAGSLTWVLSSI